MLLQSASILLAFKLPSFCQYYELSMPDLHFSILYFLFLGVTFISSVPLYSFLLSLFSFLSPAFHTHWHVWWVGGRSCWILVCFLLRGNSSTPIFCLLLLQKVWDVALFALLVGFIDICRGWEGRFRIRQLPVTAKPESSNQALNVSVP